MGRMIRLIWAFFKMTTPWLIRAGIAAGHLVLVTLAALWTGVPNATTRLAHDWTTRAMLSGVTNNYAPFIYRATVVIAFLVILAGWIILAFITVLLVTWLI